MSILNLDITKDRCPMTFVKTKLKLEELEPGDTLEILLTAGEPLNNVLPELSDTFSENLNCSMNCKRTLCLCNLSLGVLSL